MLQPRSGPNLEKARQALNQQEASAAGEARQLLTTLILTGVSSAIAVTAAAMPTAAIAAAQAIAATRVIAATRATAAAAIVNFFRQIHLHNH